MHSDYQIFNLWKHIIQSVLAGCSASGPNGNLCLRQDLVKKWKEVLTLDYNSLIKQDKQYFKELSKKFCNEHS